MATIIKAGSPAVPITVSLDDLARQACQSIEQARVEAIRIVQAAQEEARTIHRRAEEAGRLAGLAQADKELDERIAHRMQSVLPAIEQAATQLLAARQDWLTHWERGAVRVATAIAARVIRREARDTPQITLDLVAEALRLAAGDGQIELHLHPTDHEALGTQIQLLLDELRRLAPTKIVADASIEPGGCCLETRFGTIDQQFSSQLRRIEQELT